MTSDFSVSSSESGQSLLEFLKKRVDLSQSKIKKAIDSGSVLVNGRVEKFAKAPLFQGDRVVASFPVFETEVPILYEEARFRVVNKPAGLASEPQNFDGFLVHRLDKYTTGVFVLAKTPEAQLWIETLFRERLVKKDYIAVVSGKLEGGGEIDLPIDGKEAKTVWKAVKSGPDFSVIRLFPETGRTHQIRIHMKSLGYPLLGDPLYGGENRSKFQPPHYLLHASRISLAGIEVKAPLPEIIESSLKK